MGVTHRSNNPRGDKKVVNMRSSSAGGDRDTVNNKSSNGGGDREGVNNRSSQYWRGQGDWKTKGETAPTGPGSLQQDQS